MNVYSPTLALASYLLISRSKIGIVKMEGSGEIKIVDMKHLCKMQKK